MSPATKQRHKPELGGGVNDISRGGMVGNAAQIAEASSLPKMFFDQVQRMGDKPFLWAKKDREYRSISWHEAGEQASAVANALLALGVDPGDRIAIVSENRPEWLISEIGIMSIGAIAVPAYITNTEHDHVHVLEDSGASGVIVSTQKLADRLLPAAQRTGRVKFVIGMQKLEYDQSVGFELLHWDNLLTTYSGASEEIAQRAESWLRIDTAAIIYTSGTGGAPKGVMLHHGAILHNCLGAYDALLELGLEDEVFLSFLPLSHSYEHMAGQYFPISIGAQIYYAEGLEYLSRNMIEARPTIMTAVPRLYEVMHGRIVQGVEKAGGAKAKLFYKAVELGRKKYEAPGSLSMSERLFDSLLDRLVRKKVAASFGGRLKALVSGGAPLNYEIGTFFTALGLRLLQGYGLTETAPLISVNRPSHIKLRTVGPPVINTEVRIADDGEIVVRGELVMQGYWRNPDATDEMIKDGWLHTGDVGRFDDDGYIEITDRKKDIIVNSGGDTISPQRIEGFLALQPEIAQAMVSGDKRPYLVAVVVPDTDFAADWARNNGKPGGLVNLVEDPEFRGVIAAAIERTNKSLSSIENVRRFLMCAEPFTIENEMMTPSLKVRRHKVNAVWGEKLATLYGR